MVSPPWRSSPRTIVCTGKREKIGNKIAQFGSCTFTLRTGKTLAEVVELVPCACNKWGNSWDYWFYVSGGEIEDLGDLDSTLPEASGAKEGTGGESAPPSNAGKGSLVTPTSTCAGEDPVPAAAPTGGDTSVVAGEPTVEDPAASVGPS